MTKLFLSAFFFLLPAMAARAQIFADFQTSMGDFTCELDHAAAPQTVANFVGLATGERKWIDPANGIVRENTPFYDGLTFHRVVANFMNQGGSRNGLGTDGPGYQFPDETENGLSHQAHVISMANSGTYTNGSQFFITAAATPWLNGRHTVFGSVTSGIPVVDAINGVATVSEKPVVPVVIEKVTIRRVGEAAGSFDIHSQGLPGVFNVPCDLVPAPPLKVDAIPRQPRLPETVTRVFRSGDLTSWVNTRSLFLGLGPEDPGQFPIDEPTGPATSIGDRGFFRFAQAVHSDVMKPQSLGNRVLTVTWVANLLTFSFNAAGDGGTAVYSNDNPPVPRPILEIADSNSPYDWVISVSGFGYLKVSAARTGENATHYLGKHKISQWSAGSWNYLGTGEVTLTK